MINSGSPVAAKWPGFFCILDQITSNMANRGSNGEVFEKMVGIINTSIIDDSIKIHQRYFIKNLCGIDREIDVFIQTSTANIAVECKDWRSKSKRIKLELIDAFHGKTSMIPSINRRIFVARGGYQSGAKKLAECLGIELYTLDEIDIEVVKSWLEWGQTKHLKIDWSVTKIALKSKILGDRIFLAVPNQFILQVEDVGVNTVDEIIKDHVDVAFNNFQDICLKEYSQGNTKFIWPDIIDWNGPVVRASLNGTTIVIDQIYFSLIVEIIPYNTKDVNVMGYDNVLNSERTAISVSISYDDLTMNKLHLVKTKQSDVYNAYIEEFINGKIQITPLIGRDV